jgi:hypothetical protein
MWRLGPVWHDEKELVETWAKAHPFPHLVIDDFVAADALEGLLATVDDEPMERYQGDIFTFEASAPKPRTEGFIALRESFGVLMAPPLSRITGKSLLSMDMRAYAYGPGHYLLPHLDERGPLAYVYYLPSPEPPHGGELELFACRAENAELVSTESARVIEPRANRLVVFDVSDVGLHQVREVLAGLRLSLAGGFYS